MLCLVNFQMHQDAGSIRILKLQMGKKTFEMSLQRQQADFLLKGLIWQQQIVACLPIPHSPNYYLLLLLGYVL